ncbi:MAG: hypothetical protein SFU91_11480 [Chloroherpetonaceae bacterium]|nr:hypothetical protein [Chloroherpetonaceae bacterium]
MVTISVFEKSSGKPRKGIKVTIGWAWGMQDSRTDNAGDAHFDHDSGQGKVYIDGREQYKGRISGRVIVYT